MYTIRTHKRYTNTQTQRKKTKKNTKQQNMRKHVKSIKLNIVIVAVFASYI